MKRERDAGCGKVESSQEFSRRLSSALTICLVAAVARLADDPVGEGVDEGDDDELGEVYQEPQELLCPKS